MHWLPLVAMVIASALPFPLSPVPRLVTAAMEPGRSPDNHGNGISVDDISNGSFRESTPSTSLRTDSMDRSEALADYSSQSNYIYDSPQVDYSRTGEVKEKRHQSNGAEDFRLRSLHSQVNSRRSSAIDRVERKSQGIQKQMIQLAKRDPCNNTQNNTSTEDTRPAQGQLELPNLEDYSPQDNNRQVNDLFLDYHTPEDYKSQKGITSENSNFVGMTRKENHYPFSARKAKKLKVTDISVRQNYNPYWEGAEKKQLSPVTRAQAEPYNYPEKHTEAETVDKEAGRGDGWAGLEEGGGKLLEDAELLVLGAHPRVLFTPASSPPKDPPLLLMLEAELQAAIGEREERQDEEEKEDEGRALAAGRAGEEEDSAHPRPRPKRASQAYDRRGERSVCEVANEWVTDRKTAIDILGNTVSVLPEIQTPRGPLRQYFFETKCRQPDVRGTGGSGVSGRDCLGVDKKHWVSECRAKQSYVRALTTHPQKGVGWRWIRIDSSCVCVLQPRVPRS